MRMFAAVCMRMGGRGEEACEAGEEAAVGSVRGADQVPAVRVAVCSAGDQRLRGGFPAFGGGDREQTAAVAAAGEGEPRGQHES